MQASIVPVPYQHPSSCSICGYGGSDRKCWLDTGIQIDYYGAVYICDQCFNFLAGLFGYINPDVSAKILHENEILCASQEILNRRIDMLTTAIKNLELADVTVVDSDSLRSGMDSVIGADPLGVPETSESPSGDSREGEVNVGSGEGETSEPSHDEGMDKLRPDEFGFEFEFDSE
jgi:hypothetical protein